MTNDTTALTYWQQLRFYFRKPSNIAVYIAEVGKSRAGYMLLRHENATTLITEAVEMRYRGRGVAKHMIRHAQNVCRNLTAEILVTNTASIKLHEATGFWLQSEDVRTRIYRYATPADAGRN